jgi:hypothetical protein
MRREGFLFRAVPGDAYVPGDVNVDVDVDGDVVVNVDVDVVATVDVDVIGVGSRVARSRVNDPGDAHVYVRASTFKTTPTSTWTSTSTSTFATILERV